MTDFYPNSQDERNNPLTLSHPCITIFPINRQNTMAKHDKLLEKLLSGRSDSNINFNDLCNLLDKLGFDGRTKGGHHIFTKEGVSELINLQKDTNKAKEYQVRQIRNIVLKYNMGEK